jgi:molybdopterin converting factor small subunit
MIYKLIFFHPLYSSRIVYFGAPRPHSSWRELLLVAIMIGMVVGVLIKVVKKHGGSWLVKVMSKKVQGNPRIIPSISELVPANHHVNRSVVDEFKLKLDQQFMDQNKKLENLMNVVNRERDKNNQPIRDA